MSRKTINEYQEAAAETAIYGSEYLPDGNITYTLLGLVGEAGELANKWKKYLRGDIETSEGYDALKEDMAGELGDVLWYVAMLAHELGYHLEDVAKMNLDKLQSRKERNAIKGDGDNR